jgi:isoamyl acetate esterase
LVTPGPICAYRWGDHDRAGGYEPQRTAEHTALYAEKAKSVAEDLKIPHVNLWTGFLSAAGWVFGDPLVGSTSIPKNDKLGELLPDGLHFSANGNKLCFQLIFDKIKEVYPDLIPEKMVPNVPLWDMQKDILAILKDDVAKLSLE